MASSTSRARNSSAMSRASGIHLFEFAVRVAQYAGPYLCGEPVDRALSSFQFRRNARFRYVYDMCCWWEHELGVEERLAADAGKRYLRCIGGTGAWPRASIRHPCPDQRFAVNHPR